jgi:hypothetical protein
MHGMGSFGCPSLWACEIPIFTKWLAACPSIGRIAGALTGTEDMKRLLATLSLCALLTACGGTHGLRDTTPKMSSRTNKDIPTYLECVRAKWAETAEASASHKDQSGTVSANDKQGAHELVSVTADGTGALVMMYESQDLKKDYNPAYRDAAVSCL